MTIAAPPPPRASAPLPPLHLLRAGQRLPVAWGYSTVLPDMDFETFSAAGFEWDELSQKFKPPAGATKKGLPAIGAAKYADDPTTEVLCLAYDLKDGTGRKMWIAGMPLPLDLIQHLAQFDASAPPSYDQRGLIETHNSMFEFRVATRVLHERWGWPPIDLRQMRCSMAKARAYSLPGALGNLAEVLRVPVGKDKDGKKQLERFSWPRNPTKADSRTRITCAEDPDNAQKLYSYCDQDILAEAGASARMPDLIPQELDYWLADQACNWRGVGVDLESVNACISVLDQAHRKYNAELYQITGGTVARASEISKLQEWVADCTGYRMKSGDSEAIEEAIQALYKRIDDGGNDIGDIMDYEPVIRALEIRNLIGSAAVKKVYAMARMATRDARLCDLFIYHGARTGRDTHADVQPGNLPKSGPNIRWCENAGCSKPYAFKSHGCPWCGADSAFSTERSPEGEKGWTWEAVEDALAIMRHGNLELVEYFFGDAVLTISGCVRSLLMAGPGKELLCSDYSAIEAVVLAVLAGEKWRIDAFHRGESIYYHGAAGVTGKTYEWYEAYRKEHGTHHPDRNKIGKVAELALGFMGWVGAWRNFDKTDNFTDDEVKALIIKWQEASPMLKECAGGQTRGKPWKPDRFENFGYEGMFLNAIQYPGETFEYRGIKFQVLDNTMFVTLLSGRRLTYHSPRADRTERFTGIQTWSLSYMTWNSNPGMGPMGWNRMDTYAGRLVENIVQATARDLMSAAVVRLEHNGYPVVMRVHDEIVSEVPEGYGSEAEFEALMAQLPEWAASWPVRCGGTYRAKRYKK
jgi:DNA polymerase